MRSAALCSTESCPYVRPGVSAPSLPISVSSVSSVVDFRPTPADDHRPEQWVEYHYRPIEELREGDLVVASDPATGETRLARVTHAFQRISYHLRHLVLEDSAGNRHEIETTDEHPFYEARLGDFVPAGELRLGDAVRGPLGEILHVVSTRYEEHPAGIAVYNIEVESLHTYYIASPHARAPPALVHNSCRKRVNRGVYVLYHPGSKTIRYVGQGHIEDRRRAHRRDRVKGRLKLLVVAENLTYKQRRGLEQLLMEHFGGPLSANKSGGGRLLNEIWSIRPDRQDKRAVAYRTAGQALLAEALRAIEQAGLK